MVKIHATTVTSGDIRMRSFTVPRLQWPMARLYLGIRKPKRAILGMELAGEIESIGKDVTLFKEGDQVFASLFPKLTFGGYAEYKCLPEDALIAIKPDNISYGEAAAVPGGGITALLILRKVKIQNRQKILIYGASGSVGTFLVQLAKYYGAEVTGVCRTSNLDMVKSLGADQVIDYTKENFNERPDRYDIIIDAVGKLASSMRKKSLDEKCIFFNANSISGKLKSEDLVFLKKLIADEKIRIVIDRTYPIEQIVEAHRYVDKGHKKGNVVISVIDDENQ